MSFWKKGLFALAAPLFLTGCLWTPGKFASALTLDKAGTFALDYKGEIMLQLPQDAVAGDPWKPEMARCFEGKADNKIAEIIVMEPGDTLKQRHCTKAEIASQKAAYEERANGQAQGK